MALPLMALLLLPAATAGKQAEAGSGKKKAQPRVELLALEEKPAGLEVSYRVHGAFEDDRILAKLESGLEITFRHHVEARRRRSFWFDKTLAHKKVTTGVVLDSLTRQYTLRRTVNGGVVETLTTSDPEEMRAFMTEVELLQLELPEDYPRDGRTEVRVRCILETRFFLFFPYAFETDWVRQPVPTLMAGDGKDGGDAP